ADGRPSGAAPREDDPASILSCPRGWHPWLLTVAPAGLRETIPGRLATFSMNTVAFMRSFRGTGVKRGPERPRTIFYRDTPWPSRRLFCLRSPDVQAMIRRHRRQSAAAPRRFRDSVQGFRDRGRAEGGREPVRAASWTRVPPLLIP